MKKLKCCEYGLAGYTHNISFSLQLTIVSNTLERLSLAPGADPTNLFGCNLTHPFKKLDHFCAMGK
jgi:hypothetical protein